jgi:hypothetical protein
MRSIRLHCVRSVVGDRDPTESAIVEALAENGLSTSPLDAGSHAPWVVVFDCLDPALSELVRTVSRNGLERVLGVASSRAALANGASFRMLGAGASEVLTWSDRRE